MAEKERDTYLPASDESVDAILAEVLGTSGSKGSNYYELYKRYDVGMRKDATDVIKKEEPVEEKQQPAAAPAPQPTANTQSVREDYTAEQIADTYRSAAAKYEVNGYHFSQPSQPYYSGYPTYMPPAYPPYMQQPMYPPYVQPYAPYAQPYPQPYAQPYQQPYQQPYGQPAYPDCYGQQNYQAAQLPEEQQKGPASQYAAAAGERVVFDAEWENGAPPQQRPVVNPMPVTMPNDGKTFVNPAFIDPISDDAEDLDFEEGAITFSSRKKVKAPDDNQNFFQEGFSVTNNPTAADGKTEKRKATDEREQVFESFSADYELEQENKTRWMMTDEEIQQEQEIRRDEQKINEKKEKKLKKEKKKKKRNVEEQPVEEVKAEEQADAEDLDSLDAFDDFEQMGNEQPAPFWQEESEPVDSYEMYDPEATIYGGEEDLYYNNPKVEENEKKNKKPSKFKAFILRNVPHKGQTKREFISCLVMNIAFVVLIGGLVFCGIYLRNYKNAVNKDAELEKIVEEIRRQDLDEVQLDALWNDLKTLYPDVVFPDGLNPTLAKLYAINQDVVGWLTIENIDLSTVVLQSYDNDYYLYRNTYKEQTEYGTPFTDYRNEMSSKEFSRNTIIYGHNTYDGLKFYNLTKYTELSNYRTAPVIEMETKFNGTTYWKIFAVTISDSETDEFEYLYTDFATEDAFLSLITEIKAHSMFDIPVDVQAGDNILTLYTCYPNYFQSGRLCVFARQVRTGESQTVDTSSAAVNIDCLYPAAYYGKTYDPDATIPGSNVETANTTTEAPTEAPTTVAEEEDYGYGEEDYGYGEEDYGYGEEDYGYGEEDYGYGEEELVG